MAKVVTQAVFTISGTAAQGLARIAIPILVGNFAGKSTLGTVSFILSVTVLLSMVWPAPAGTAASRYLSETSSPSAGALHTLKWSTAFSLVVIAAASGLIVGIGTSSAALGIIAALVAAAYSAYFFTRGVFLGRFRARRLAAWEVSGAIIAVIGTVASLLAGQWIGAIAALGLGYVVIALAGWPWRPVGIRVIDRGVVSFTAHNAVANAASNGMVQLAMVVVFAMTAPAPAGLFAAAFSLATPTSLLGQTLNQVLIPHLTNAAGIERPRLRPLAAASAKLTAITLVPFAIVFIASPLLVAVLYPAFDRATPVLRVLLTAMYFFTVALYPAAGLTAWGRAGYLVVSSCGALVIGIGAMIVLTALAGPLGTAFGLLAGTIALFVLTTIAAVAAVRRHV